MKKKEPQVFKDVPCLPAMSSYRENLVKDIDFKYFGKCPCGWESKPSTDFQPTRKKIDKHQKSYEEKVADKSSSKKNSKSDKKND